jgi:transcriptional regulator GlxA family with amidase domain
MRAKRATPPGDRTRLAILLGPHSSVALAMLFRAAFERANRLLEEPRYAVCFVSALGPGEVSIQGVKVDVARPRGSYDYFVVTPFDGFTQDQQPGADDVRMVRRQHEKGAVVASACLGALTLASAGLLDGREATTHWAWAAAVRARHPAVNWAVHRMICDRGDVLTAGGYLGVVDLALYIVGATSSRETAHRLGQVLLADSVRQRQSVFAQRLIEPAVEHGALSDLAQWIDRHLGEALTASGMARCCRMSLRSFHRRFVAAYGVTPRKFVQLRRIERAQDQLRNSRKSIEQILELVGVSDVASFRRLFQRELGMSPAEYRRRLRPHDA